MMSYCFGSKAKGVIMNKKLAKEVSQPFMIIGGVAMLVLSLVIMWFNLYLGLGAVAITAGLYFFHIQMVQVSQ